MKRPYEHKAPLIRKLLRANIDGMTVQQLCLNLKTDERHVRRVLDRMPDAYIASWTTGKYVAAKWRVAYVPPHCPRPTAVKDTQKD